MRLSIPTWGTIIGAGVATAVLVTLSVMLLNSGGANYKVLVAVWLWTLPALGLFAGLGYTAGKIAGLIVGSNRSRGSNAHAKAR
jgi:hypothetical protein